MAEILLDNILRLFSTETFGKDKSAYYVGGEKKLMNLIEAGKIESDKPTNVQNGKWHCNAAQVLLHCRCAGRKVISKKRKILYLVDSIEVSKKEFIAAFVLVTVVSVNYICFRYYEDRKQNKDSL